MRRLVVLGIIAAGLLAGGCVFGDDGSDAPSETLLITRQEGLATFETDGANERLIIENPPDSLLIEPASSPDGSRIAYVRQLTPFVQPGVPTETGMDLWLANADGSDARPFIEHSLPNEMVRSPAWLPDGQRMVVSLQRIEGGRFVLSLEEVDLATGARRVLREGAFQPAVSEDGAQLAYLEVDDAFNQTLWVSNYDGSNARAIAGPEQELVSFTSPRFSPDGRTLAFSAGEPIELQIRSGERYAVSRGASAGAARYDGTPKDIWLYDLSTCELRKPADLNLDDPGIAWSRDGSRLYVYAGAGLLAIDAATGESTRLGDGMFHGFVDVVRGG
jgi:Tol biopolymer transport system component